MLVEQNTFSRLLLVSLPDFTEEIPKKNRAFTKLTWSIKSEFVIAQPLFLYAS